MHRFATAALMSLPLAAVGAAEPVTPAHAARLMVAPGLYQIERDHTVSHAGTGLTSREQRSAYGNSVLTDAAPDGTAVRRIPGQPQTTCVPPPNGRPPALPPTLSTSTCETISSTVSGNSLMLVAQCRTGRMSTTIERLDASHWDIVTRSEIAATGRAPELGAMQVDGRERWTRIADHCKDARP